MNNTLVYCHQQGHGTSVVSELALKISNAQYCYTVVNTVVWATDYGKIKNPRQLTRAVSLKTRTTTRTKQKQKPFELAVKT
jgi:hypothetical protein